MLWHKRICRVLSYIGLLPLRIMYIKCYLVLAWYTNSCFSVTGSRRRVWTAIYCSPIVRYAIKRSKLRTVEVTWTMGGKLLTLLVLLCAVVALLCSLASAEQGRMTTEYSYSLKLRGLWNVVHIFAICDVCGLCVRVCVCVCLRVCVLFACGVSFVSRTTWRCVYVFSNGQLLLSSCLFKTRPDVKTFAAH